MKYEKRKWLMNNEYYLISVWLISELLDLTIVIFQKSAESSADTYSTGPFVFGAFIKTIPCGTDTDSEQTNTEATQS